MRYSVRSYLTENKKDYVILEYRPAKITKLDDYFGHTEYQLVYTTYMGDRYEKFHSAVEKHSNLKQMLNDLDVSITVYLLIPKDEYEEYSDRTTDSMVKNPGTKVGQEILDLIGKNKTNKMPHSNLKHSVLSKVRGKTIESSVFLAIKNYSKSIGKQIEQEMKKMTPQNSNVYLHVSPLNYKIGENVNYKRSIETNDHRANLLLGAIEGQLEKYRPSSKPNRLKCVYMFKDVKDAHKWFRQFEQYTQNQYLYEVVPGSKPHKANMKIVEQIEKALAHMSEEEEWVMDSKDSEDMWDEEEGITVDDKIKEVSLEFEKEIEKLCKDYWSSKEGDTRETIWEYLSTDGFKVVGVKKLK